VSNDRPDLLSKWLRVSCGIGATALGVTGVVATFTTENGTGTGALIAAALVLALVGATGRLPERGSIAGVDYDLGERVIERALTELPEEQRQQVAEIAVQEAEASPGLQAAARRRAWKIEAERAIERCAPPDSSVEFQVEAGTTRFDAMVMTDAAAVVITLQYGRRPPQGGTQSLVHMMNMMQLGPSTRELTVTATATSKPRLGPWCGRATRMIQLWWPR
jgi:hypothetical protein